MRRLRFAPHPSPLITLERRDDIGWVHVCPANTVSHALAKVRKLVRGTTEVAVYRAVCDGVEAATFFAVDGKVAYNPSTAERWAKDVQVSLRTNTPEHQH